VRGVDEADRFPQLGGLEIGDIEIDPAPCPVDLHAYAGDEWQKEGEERNQGEGSRQKSQPVQGKSGSRDEDDNGGKEEESLAQREIIGAPVHPYGITGRSRPHGDKADQREHGE